MRGERGSTGIGDATAAQDADEARPRMRRQFVAAPVYDSRLGRRASGIRGLSTVLPRLMYTAGGFEVDLQIRASSTAGRLRLLGQVLNEDFEPCAGRVKLVGAFGTVETDLDDCGHFSIDGLTSSGHRLEIGLTDILILIPMLYV